MKKALVLCLTLLLTFLVACAAPSTQQVGQEDDDRLVTVYRSPT